MGEKIIYADDEASFRRLVTMFLEREGYTVYTAVDGSQALETLAGHPDAALMILDVMMPEMDGWQTSRAIREFSEIPILMLTALGDEQSEVRGLNRGADDYISKPFTNKLLVTRVKALLRRARSGSSKRIAAAGLELDEAAREVVAAGRRVALTPKEFELLRYLALNRGNVLSREQILDRVWGYWYEGDPRTLDTHIKSLRAKLGPAGSAIMTVRGSGYSFRGDEA